MNSSQFGIWCILMSGAMMLILLCIYIEQAVYKSKGKKWRDAYPTLKEYVSIYPHCKTDRGIKCFNCSSFQRRFIWWDRSGQGRKVFYCQHCGEYLYRSNG